MFGSLYPSLSGTVPDQSLFALFSFNPLVLPFVGVPGTLAAKAGDYRGERSAVRQKHKPRDIFRTLRSDKDSNANMSDPVNLKLTQNNRRVVG